MEFRAVTPNDADEIHDIFLRCWNISYKDILSEKVRSNMTDEKVSALWMSSLVNNAERETVLGEINHKIVGFFRIGRDPDGNERGHLFSLYVTPELAGFGHGACLLGEAVGRIRKQGLDQASLWVFKDNLIAQSLYTKFGFKKTGNERVTAAWEAIEIEMLNSNITQ